MANNVNWEQLRAEYCAGNVSCRQLGEKYHVSPNVVSKKATKEGWKKLREKTGEKAAEKTVTRVARARARAAIKGLDVVKYTTKLWTENLNQLNELISKTPSYMLSVPTFASGVAKGLDTTYDLLMKMAGRSSMDKKIKIEQEKLKIERQKFKMEQQKFLLEKERFEAEQKARDSGQAAEEWTVTVDEGTEGDPFV